MDPTITNAFSHPGSPAGDPARGRPTLVLVPTDAERAALASNRGPELERVGFGAIAAAARSAQLIAQKRPGRILVLGICGTYAQGELPIGQAAQFGRVSQWGLGAGSGAEHIGSQEMGLAQWPAEGERKAVLDELPLASGDAALVSVCAASATPEEAGWVASRYPHAQAEDMETFGIALAAHLADVPVHCIRGASNLAGDRNKGNWRIPEALQASLALARKLFPELWAGTA